MPAKKPGMSEMERYARTRNWANIVLGFALIGGIAAVILFALFKAVFP